MNLSSEVGRIRPWRWAALSQAPATPAVCNAAPAPADLLAAARQEADAILRAAQQNALAEAEAIRAQARAQGEREGLARAVAEAAALRAAAADVLSQAHVERRRILAALSGDIGRLALAVAERVLEQDLSAQADAAVALARRLTRRLDGPATVRAHPDLAPLLEAELVGANHLVRVQPDLGVDSGGIIVESAEGVVDATLGERLRRVAATIVGEDARV